MRFAYHMALAGLALGPAASGFSAELTPLVNQLRSVGPMASGNREAMQAWQQLSNADAEQLPEILSGIDGAGPLSANWLAAAVEAVAAREMAKGGALPAKELEAFVLDTSHAPRARRLAFEWLTRVDPSTPDRLIPDMLDDPSVEFRRDAVTRQLDTAKLEEEGQQNAEAIRSYRRALDAARDVDQIKLIEGRLTALGETVDLPKHFGFIMEWKLIGPFDHTGSINFDKAFPPESEIDFAATYEGKDGAEISWNDHQTEDQYGTVNLNTAIAKHNGAIAYAVADFDSPADQPVELRLGCINANKIWLNGQLVHQREAYHAGSEIDQYMATGAMHQGKNRILLKICQNEQKEDWAQDWQFQLRVCDATGTAILSTDRPPTPAKAISPQPAAASAEDSN
ncbi:MAG: hypothetical protein KF708_04905 [Pirellulales bacterium]|nr:hypothetical protein [Pirellulales bacterium]